MKKKKSLEMKSLVKLSNTIFSQNIFLPNIKFTEIYLTAKKEVLFPLKSKKAWAFFVLET